MGSRLDKYKDKAYSEKTSSNPNFVAKYSRNKTGSGQHINDKYNQIKGRTRRVKHKFNHKFNHKFISKLLKEDL